MELVYAWLVSLSVKIFSQEMYLARRSTGLKYNKLSYENFKEICCVIWKYQFTINITELNKDIIDWLYYYTDGIVAILIQLVHDSQEFVLLIILSL